MAAIERAPLRNPGCVVTSSTLSEPMYTTRPSRSDSRCSLPLFNIAGGLVIVDLVEDAAALGREWTVVHARRPAGIGRGERLLSALALLVVADDEVALHHVDLLPMVVHEGLGGERPGLDLQQPRAAAFLVRLIQVRGEDLLEEAVRISRRPFPSGFQVDAYELEMLLGLHGLLHASVLANAWCVTRPSKGGKLAMSARAAARSGDAKAACIASAVSNSSCATRSARPRFTGQASLHSTGVCIT